MQIYINLYYVAIGLVGFGGFAAGRYLLTRKSWVQTEQQCQEYYKALYNEQMEELITRYNQERVALAHRYGDLTQQLEAEIQVIRNAMDPDRTVRTFIDSNEEAV